MFNERFYKEWFETIFLCCCGYLFGNYLSKGSFYETSIPLYFFLVATVVSFCWTTLLTYLVKKYGKHRG